LEKIVGSVVCYDVCHVMSFSFRPIVQVVKLMLLYINDFPFIFGCKFST